MRLITDIQFHSDHVLVICKGQSIRNEDIASIAETVAHSQSTPAVVLVDVSRVESFRNLDLSLLWLHCMQAKAKGWQAALVGVPEELRLQIASGGLDEIIPTFSTGKDALNTLSQSPKTSATSAA